MTDKEALLARARAVREAIERIQRGELPTANELAAAPKLDWWCVTDSQPWPELTGVVTGHPALPDGAQITTSKLLWLSDDRSSARTVSRFYRLGEALEDVLSSSAEPMHRN